MKSALIKKIAVVITLLFVCSLSTVVTAGSVKDWGNHGKDWGNFGKDWGNHGKDQGNFGKDQGNHGKDWGKPKHDATPIPPSVLLLASGLGGLALFRKKFRR